MHVFHAPVGLLLCVAEVIQSAKLQLSFFPMSTKLIIFQFTLLLAKYPKFGKAWQAYRITHSDSAIVFHARKSDTQV